MLGNGRLEAMCFDGEKRLAHIRGKLRKKVWINNGDMYVNFGNAVTVWSILANTQL